MTAQGYRHRLDGLVAARGRLCVGIDPHPGLLEAWGLEYSAQGVEAFGRAVVAALGGVVAVFKPQVALFECHGSAGLAALERVLADIRDTGALSIADAKRGDIGSTMDAYARAWLSDESPLRADAMTASPYLGLGSLAPALNLAADTGRGVYVLARTSNPEGTGVQTATTQGGTTVAQAVVDLAEAENLREGSDHVGVVVGGTRHDPGVVLDDFTGSVLVPGIGAQGGTLAGVRAAFGSTFERVLPTVSRGVLGAGPDPKRLRGAVTDLLAAER